MKIKDCYCGCYAFVARPVDGTYLVMCRDGGLYNHISGPVRKTQRKAIKAWNKMMKEEEEK